MDLEEAIARLEAYAKKQRAMEMTEAKAWPPEEHTVRLWDAHGLRCAIAQGTFSLCGYIHVPATHPAAGKHYDDLDVQVHGGLTFTCKAIDGGRWFGFDTGHAGDNVVIPETGTILKGRVWTEADVAHESERLAEQLAAHAPAKEPNPTVPSLRFIAGRLLCRFLRDYLREREVLGMPIRWMEGSGLVEREFVVSGPQEDLDKIRQDIDAWIKEHQLDRPDRTGRN